MGSKFSVIPARALFDTRLEQEDITLLTVLCMYVGDDGTCYPSLDTLAKVYSPLVGRSKVYDKSSMSKKMDTLEAYGYVTKIRQQMTASGSYRSNLWYISHDAALPPEFDRREIQPTVEKTPTEIQPSVEFNRGEIQSNVPDGTSHTQPTLKETCWKEITDVFVTLNGYDFQRWDEAWDKFPDKRRHDYAKNRAVAANPRKFKFYLDDFYGYDPDKPKTWGDGKPLAPPRYRRPEPVSTLRTRTD